MSPPGRRISWPYRLFGSYPYASDEDVRYIVETIKTTANVKIGRFFEKT